MYDVNIYQKDLLFYTTVRSALSLTDPQTAVILDLVHQEDIPRSAMMYFIFFLLYVLEIAKLW